MKTPDEKLNLLLQKCQMAKEEVDLAINELITATMAVQDYEERSFFEELYTLIEKYRAASDKFEPDQFIGVTIVLEDIERIINKYKKA